MLCDLTTVGTGKLKICLLYMPLTLAEDNRLHVDGALQVTTMTLFWKEN